MVCGSPGQGVPKHLNVSIECPEYCRVHELDITQFYIDSTGQMFLNGSHKYANVSSCHNFK